MSIRDAISRLLRKGSDTGQSGFTTSILLPRWAHSTPRESRTLLELFHTSPRAAALWKLAYDLSVVGYGAYRTDAKGNKTLATHGIEKLLANPIADRKDIDDAKLLYLTHAYLEIMGEAYWMIVRGASGQPVECMVIPGAWVLDIPAPGKPYYSILPNSGSSHGIMSHIATDDVVAFRTPDITDPYGRGRGYSELIGDEMLTDELASKFQKNLYHNDASPKMVITVAEADPEQIKTLEAQWNEKYSGPRNAGRTGFVRGSGVSITKLTDSLKELDYIESRRYLRDAAIEHWQIPKEMFGILENSNRATISAARELYELNCINPRVERLQRAINRQLMPMFGEADVTFEFDPVVKEDKDTKIATASSGVSLGTLTVNEWRTAAGWEPVKGGDVFLRNFTTVQDPRQTGDGKQLSTKSASEPDRAWRGIHQGIVDKTAASRERQAIDELVKVVKAERKKVIEGYLSSGVAPDVTSGEHLQNMRDALALIHTESAIDGVKIGIDMLNRRKGIKATAAEIDFDLLRGEVLERAKKITLQHAVAIQETTKRELAAIIADGVEDGLPLQGIARNMRHSYAGLLELEDGITKPGYRAQMIARTETASAVNDGQQYIYQREGVEKKEWISTKDSRTREEHIAADGQTVLISESFDVAGESLQYPGDQSASPENVINCRCTIAPVIE